MNQLRMDYSFSNQVMKQETEKADHYQRKLVELEKDYREQLEMMKSREREKDRDINRLHHQQIALKSDSERVSNVLLG